jgi:hypothetical protein
MTTTAAPGLEGGLLSLLLSLPSLPQAAFSTCAAATGLGLGGGGGALADAARAAACGAVPALLYLGFALAALRALAALLGLLTGGAGVGNAGGAGGAGAGSAAGAAFALAVLWTRARNALCGACDRRARRYQSPPLCQVPHVASLHDVLAFALGFRERGLFVEVGAYDGESFSNTAGLADLGWTGHYLEPIPKYAAACAARHAASVRAGRVKVHTVCAGGRDGETVRLSTAGPFTSAVADEIASVAGSKLNDTLRQLGWTHAPAAGGGAAEPEAAAGARKRRASSAAGAGAAAASASAAVSAASAAAALAASGDEGHKGVVVAKTVSLDTFMRQQGIAAGGAIDVLVVDVEGLELPILRGFSLARFRPKLCIVEIQELNKRFRANARAQADAAALFAMFKEAGYSILYKDMINTVFVHDSVECVGGE